ncbi:MAG TPA: hypothetical protein VMF29_02290 [Candidatus Edwardsbacteria bacterium]|nr:hypothetical protein [Candidatus Edwardsbacteria bacterium]
MKRTVAITGLLALALGCAKQGSPTAAQSPSSTANPMTSIAGAVTDSAGAPIGGVTVYVGYGYVPPKRPFSGAKSCSLLTFTIRPYAGGIGILEWADTLERRSAEWKVERAVGNGSLSYHVAFSLPAGGNTVTRGSFYYFDTDTAGVANRPLYYRISEYDSSGVKTIHAADLFYYTRHVKTTSDGRFALAGIPVDSLVSTVNDTGAIDGSARISRTVTVYATRDTSTYSRPVSLTKDTVTTVNFTVR